MEQLIFIGKRILFFKKKDIRCLEVVNNKKENRFRKKIFKGVNKILFNRFMLKFGQKFFKVLSIMLVLIGIYFFIFKIRELFYSFIVCFLVSVLNSFFKLKG